MSYPSEDVLAHVIVITRTPSGNVFFVYKCRRKQHQELTDVSANVGKMQAGADAVRTNADVGFAVEARGKTGAGNDEEGEVERENIV